MCFSTVETRGSEFFLELILKAVCGPTATCAGMALTIEDHRILIDAKLVGLLLLNKVTENNVFTKRSRVRERQVVCVWYVRVYGECIY